YNSKLQLEGCPTALVKQALNLNILEETRTVGKRIYTKAVLKDSDENISIVDEIT
ncbi:Hypothetical predicted protein, partial [Paramuricea clavata]